MAIQASSASLCASVRTVLWADVAEQQLSRLALSACDVYADVRILNSGATDPLPGHPKICLKLEVARQASSPSLCASVRAVPWADEAEQQLSRLALSACKLSADFCMFGACLTEAPVTDPEIYV